MIEHDLAELDAFHSAVVVELEPDLLGVAVDLWELDLVPEFIAEL